MREGARCIIVRKSHCRRDDLGYEHVTLVRSVVENPCDGGRKILGDSRWPWVEALFVAVAILA